MSLTIALKKLAEGSAQRHPGAAQDTMKQAIDQLKDTPIIEQALKSGDRLPEISLPNATGTVVNLQELLKTSRLVITFYRGGWCPYCNLELRAFQNALDEIKSKGAQLVAISPELPDNALTTQEKNELTFEVLSDVDNEAARKLNLVYQLREELVNLYNKFGIDLDQSQGNTDNSLPIAATYIVEQDGTISYDFLKEDYKLRADPEEVLSKL